MYCTCTRYIHWCIYYSYIMRSYLSISTACFLLLTVLLAVLSQLSFIENVLDLKFFFGINLPFQLYHSGLRYFNNGQLPNRTVEIRQNCTGLTTLPFTVQHPVLFKNCLSQNATVEDFILFENNPQNLFPACKGQKLLRYFQFVNYNGETKPIIEDVPCNTSTLREKMDAFYRHKLSNKYDGATSENDQSYFEVHTYMMNNQEKSKMELNIKSLMKAPPENSLTQKMLGVTMTVFLHAGRSAVYYLHSHMDHFLSFCLAEEKTWHLIDPIHSDSFDSVWSGNAQIQLQEKEPNVPHLIVKQEKGDILFIPPWWLQETMVKKTAKNIGFNLHYGIRGQVTLELAHLFRNNPSFFYSTIKPDQTPAF